MRTLVTGAGGFIGRALVNSLVKNGDHVIAVGRSLDAAHWDPKIVSVVRGDVCDAATMGKAMVGVERVFHLAAATATRSPALSHRINVDGTRTVAMAAMKQESPPVLVFVSSLAAAGPRERLSVEGDESHPVSHYGRTKLLAESALRELSSKLPTTIVRPPCVIGPGDTNLLSLVKTVAAGWNLVLSKTDRYSYISVTDLVPGMIAAFENGLRLEPSGEQGLYFLTDPQPITFVELAEMIATALDRSPVRHVQIPRWVGWMIGCCGELVLRGTGKKTFLNLDKIREGVAGSWMCDGRKAQRELGFSPQTDFQTRIDEAIASYCHNDPKLFKRIVR